MVDCQLPCKENLTICRAATGMAESHFLNQILINILSTATSPRISIKNKNKTKQKRRSGRSRSCGNLLQKSRGQTSK